jgi:hypothetical protein
VGGNVLVGFSLRSLRLKAFGFLNAKTFLTAKGAQKTAENAKTSLMPRLGAFPSEPAARRSLISGLQMMTMLPLLGKLARLAQNNHGGFRVSAGFLRKSRKSNIQTKIE